MFDQTLLAPLRCTAEAQQSLLHMSGPTLCIVELPRAPHLPPALISHPDGLLTVAVSAVQVLPWPPLGCVTPRQAPASLGLC